MAALCRRAGGVLVMTASALSLAACPAAPPQQVPPSEASSYRAGGGERRPAAEPEPPPPSQDARVPDGEACYGAGECASGVCEGEGCGVEQPGKCVAASRACSASEQVFCSCAGQAFRAPGDCPAQRFSRRGACAAQSRAPARPVGTPPGFGWTPANRALDRAFAGAAAVAVHPGSLEARP